MTLDLYSAFGNRVRNQLINCLSARPKNVTELIGNCGLSQSAVSQHLAKLKQTGLVSTHREGKEVYYSLISRKIGQVSKQLISLEKELS